MKSSFFERKRFIACYIVLILANIACAQKAVTPETAQPIPAVIPALAKKAEPVISREEWTRQHQAYRAKKKEFLTRLRTYIETDHTDPVEFVRQMSDLIGGVLSESRGYYREKIVRLTNVQHPIESATWRGTSPLVIFSLSLALGSGTQSTKNPEAGCITDTEVSEVFTAPNWSHVDESRVIGHSQHNNRTFTAKNPNVLGSRPSFVISRFVCVSSIHLNFVKE